MRRIQIERKLFELFGCKFFFFEYFKDLDLNIDDISIYRYDNPEQLVKIFATNQFFEIWNDPRRVGAGVLCACEGHLNVILSFLKKKGIKAEAYATSDCGLKGEPRVLYFMSTQACATFIQQLTSVSARSIEC